MPDALGEAQPATPRAPLQRLRSERLIAVGRILLASSSLLAIWIDPAEPVKLPAVTYGLLMAYVAYSCGVTILVWRSERPSNRWRLAAHAFDLLVFTSLIYLSDGPASPFISYFVFALVCASVRWQWTGTIWTAAIALTLFLSAGIYFSLVLHDPAFKLDNFIIRGVYLVVIAVLLGQLGAHERQTLHEMSLLASWPDYEPADTDEQLRGTAEHAVRILGAPRLLFVWAVCDEAWLQIGYWDGSFRLGREPLASLRPLVSDRIRPLSFFTPDVTTGRVETWRGHEQQTTARAGQWINTTLQQRFSMRAVSSLSDSGRLRRRPSLLSRQGTPAGRGSADRRHRCQHCHRAARSHVSHATARARRSGTGARQARARPARRRASGLYRRGTGERRVRCYAGSTRFSRHHPAVPMLFQIPSSMPMT